MRVPEQALPGHLPGRLQDSCTQQRPEGGGPSPGASDIHAPFRGESQPVPALGLASGPCVSVGSNGEGVCP